MPAVLLLAVADDNTGYLLRRYAEKCGFRTERANRPELVLRLAHHLAPVAIILEVGGVGTWGHEVLLQVKTDAITCRIPIVLYVWLMDAGDVYGEQVDATLHHPLLYEDFLTSMEAIGLLPPQAGSDRHAFRRR